MRRGWRAARSWATLACVQAAPSRRRGPGAKDMNLRGELARPRFSSARARGAALGALGALALIGAAGCRAALEPCPELNASAFRDGWRGAAPSARMGMGDVNIRVYGGGEVALAAHGHIVNILASEAGAAQVQRANVVHYFEIAPGRTRLDVADERIACDCRPRPSAEAAAEPEAEAEE